ncbi:DMT family transporter [uncultured Piscinibacter sp.]|uniref:DMT family transporter n=1 Tax=uncultured Piscinibacter sp. TaxID=1131835 RepID=UPI002617FAE4|nr:DMT family transporter [uncultured Piscinibacter sp.]
MSLASHRTPFLWPALALTLNAFVWGTSWWPFRQLEARGLHPLWATVLIYAVAVLVILALRPRALGQLVRTPTLWVLVLASGTTNAAFNWAVTLGDVVRVVLLFYLMPLWTVLLARLLLHEPLTRTASARVVLALAGAAIVLWPAERSGWEALPLPRSLPDWLGVIGGFSFALNNVMLRREAHRPEEGRVLAMFCGGMGVAGALALVLSGDAAVPGIPAPATLWIAGVAAMALLFLVGNLALQYGAARLPANVTAVVMLTEILFASVSALALGGGSLTAQLFAGGLLILLAALLSTLSKAPSH